MNSSTRVAGGASSVLPAHRRQVVVARGHALSAAASRYRSNRAIPLRLVSVRAAAEHSSPEARRGELFSGGGRHRLPPLNPKYAVASPPIAYPEKSLVQENEILQNKEREARIKKELQEPELLSSPYDTAWVAMVPLQGSPQSPCFPQCVEWILQNQGDNGSWGINEFDLSTNKCSLLSTLACIIALKKWNVGPEHIKRGLNFIGRNFSIAMDEKILDPIGFNITFTGMIDLAIAMGLEFPMEPTEIDGCLQLRQMELKRFVGNKSYGRESYMAYTVEGLGNILDWNEVMKFQRKNGSLFNSPSATAAALIYNYDDKALKYLKLLVSKFGSSVPTVFPINIHCQLSMVDSLEKTGISRYFISEIKNILDTTYSLWLQRDEEIMLDVATCAMAFRILRMNGYDVYSDELSHVAEASDFHSSLQGYLNDTKAILELFKASRVSVSKDEQILDNIGYWSSSLLMEKMSSDDEHRLPILGEVGYVLKFPFYAVMDRVDHRKNIENFDARGYHMLKMPYLPCRVYEDHLAFAIEDFNDSQSIYQDELLDIESWVKENKLDQLEFARQKQIYCHLASCATIFHPEQCDARTATTKNSVLVTIVDDFFDVGGSKEEIENLVALVDKWDDHHELQFYSERVKILFFAIYNTTNQLGEMAFAIQNRDVRNHFIELWVQLLRSMTTEAEWVRSQYVPTIDEYMKNASTSIGLEVIVTPSIYFVGQELSEGAVKDPEFNELIRLTNTCGRFLNDIQGFEREESQGKVNSISLRARYGDGSMSSEAAKKVVQESLDSSGRGALRLLVREDSVVPRICKEMFWKMCKVNQSFYFQTDGYSSPTEMLGQVNKVLYEPLKLQIGDPSLDVRSEQ